MFWPSKPNRLRSGPFSFRKMRRLARRIALILLMACPMVCNAGDLGSRAADGSWGGSSVQMATNIAQFSSLAGAERLAGCDFHLTGVVTLTDTNRDLVVLQDATGAVALNFRGENQRLQVGQLVTLDGTNCCPLFSNFPDYPYRPSGHTLCPTFEAPANWGKYYLTRMRGCLHPLITGNYRFWTASDNSSELWLSTDANPANARKIASIPRYGFVEPLGWSQYPSQRSELIELQAGQTYYIEALQEQTDGGDYLSIAWQPPGETAISIIDGRYLTPWTDDPASPRMTAQGVLREYWTNYFSGDLTGLAGPRPFESALAVKSAGIHILGPGELPKPIRLALNQELPEEDNYRWVQAEGVVKFKATDGEAAFLELSDGEARIQVCASHWALGLLAHLTNAVIRVEGVCERVYGQNLAAPGQIWASATNSITVIGLGTTNAATLAGEQPILSRMVANPAMRGFYNCRGVVTFNDHVLGKDYIFLQQDDTPLLVNLENRAIQNEFKVGQDVDLGGALEPGNFLPIITPLVVTQHGLRALPVPITQPLGLPDSAKREGKWNELAGVVRSVNPNGTLSIVGKDGPACLWLGQTSANDLARYVDSRVSARGVLLLTLVDTPLLLVPSRNFLDVVEAAPADPFSIAPRSIADLLTEDKVSPWSHRVRVMGEVTYEDADSFFLQDTTGGIRVRTSGRLTINVGDPVEVLAFPMPNDFFSTLTEALVRPAGALELARPRDLDLSEGLPSRQNGTLVQISAELLARKTNGLNQVLELQEKQRVFFATLATTKGSLPEVLPGSRLRITGVCADEMAATPLIGGKPPSAQFLTSLNLLLRTPKDVTLLSGPLWWTWRKTAMLFGILVTILVVALLWVRLLHRRLERQREAQLAFSRRVLERLEDERRRIAVNLHDSLGQTLMLIKNHAILAIQRPSEETGLRHRLDEISGVTSQAIEEVRRITHGLRPYQLDRLGLTQAIRASVSRASENSSIVFACRVKDMDGVFDKDAEIHVFRIVQEAITNVVKHSAATEAAVVILKRSSVVSLSIRDNGRGFDPAQPSSKPHDLGYGLSGIAERVRILGAALVISSRPGEGTSLTVEVPVPILKP